MRNVGERNAKLRALLAARLVDEGFTNVTIAGNLSLSFVHAGIQRTLEFAVEQVDGLLEPRAQRTLGLCGRVSTFVLLAFGHELLPELLLSLTCMPRMRFVVKAPSHEAFVARAGELLGAAPAGNAVSELPYRLDDAFAGAPKVFAICATASHSFVRALLGALGEDPPPADIFDTFEDQHRHHQPPEMADNLAVRLGNLHALLGAPEAVGEKSAHANAHMARLSQRTPCAEPADGSGHRGDPPCKGPRDVPLEYKRRGGVLVGSYAHEELLAAAVSLGEQLTAQPCLGSHAEAATRAWREHIHDGAWHFQMSSSGDGMGDSPTCRQYCVNACDELFDVKDCSGCTKDGGQACYPGAPGWREGGAQKPEL